MELVYEPIEELREASRKLDEAAAKMDEAARKAEDGARGPKNVIADNLDSSQEPIARFESLRLYPDRIVQSTPATFKALALPGIEYCRWERHRYPGLAGMGVVTGAAAVAIATKTMGDGPLWWAPVWIGLACISAAMFLAYARLAAGVMTIRGMFGGIIEPRGTRGPAVDFLKAVMAARQDLATVYGVDFRSAKVDPTPPAKDAA